MTDATEQKIMPSRRGLLTGLISFVAAPAIVRAGSLMPVKGIPLDTFADDFTTDNLLMQREEMFVLGYARYRFDDTLSGSWSNLYGSYGT